MKIKLAGLVAATVTAIAVIASLGNLGYFGKDKTKPNSPPPASNQTPPPSPSEPTARPNIALPTDGFLNRTTKKPFGIYITPENSPIQPERFTGYHTGTDAEYEDTQKEVPVDAICEGDIVEARFVSGYGGAVAQKCELDSRIFFVIYGHLNPASFPQAGRVAAGDQIGILGKGYSRETDGERKHLHLGIHKDTPDWRGYVQNEEELAEWEEPVEFLRKNT